MAPYQENGKTYSAWLPKWKANGWRNSQKKPVENKDLWEMLDRTAGIHVVTWVHTAGHATCTENNRVDSLAFNKAQSLKKGG
jgi:ribonuclease HI